MVLKDCSVICRQIKMPMHTKRGKMIPCLKEHLFARVAFIEAENLSSFTAFLARSIIE